MENNQYLEQEYEKASREYKINAWKKIEDRCIAKAQQYKSPRLQRQIWAWYKYFIHPRICRKNLPILQKMQQVVKDNFDREISRRREEVQPVSHEMQKLQKFLANYDMCKKPLPKESQLNQNNYQDLYTMKQLLPGQNVTKIILKKTRLRSKQAAVNNGKITL